MKKSFLYLFFILVPLLSMRGQKIDFDFSGRNNVTADGYTGWAVPQAASDTKTVDGITFKVEAIGNSTVLRSQWSKNDVNSKGLKLTGDAVVAFIQDNTNNTPNQTSTPMAMKVTISGLSAGKHTIQAYHNGVNGYSNLAPIDIYLSGGSVAGSSDATNGNLVIDDFKQSENAQTLEEAALSLVTVDVAEGGNVVLTYQSDPKEGTTYGSTLVYLNALLIDQASVNSQASAPYPTDGDYHFAADGGNATLSWTAADASATHYLYIGTDSANLRLAATTKDTTYNATGLSNLYTYYWRVDEEIDGTTTQGQVWSFRPRHLAFPGAEGYGKYAIGGRGGVVYHVTTLEDNGDDNNPIEGSLRYGIKKVTGPRTIVFDVGGVIDLKSRLTCADPYVTIAGQTAPGNGVMLRTCPFGMASDGITRFLRLRLGHKKLVNNVIPGGRNSYSYGDEAGTSDETTLSGLDGMGMAGNDNAIMDHCSISWTIDEAFSSRNAKSVTLQHTLISEALNQAGHPNYSAGTRHGYAATIGGGEMSSALTVGSYHHNLLAHCEGRNWSLSGGLDGAGAYDGHHDIFNNVVYNWGGRATDGGSHEINFTNNFYKEGPATTQHYLLRLQLEGTGTGSQSAYVSGNIRQTSGNGSLTNDKLNDTYRYELSGGQQLTWTPFVSEPFFESLAEVEDAKAAYKNVLSDVGANEPFLDLHDQRMMSETLKGTYSVTGSRSGKKGLPDSEEDNGCEGFDGLGIKTATRDADWDTDGDGMPDWWEKAAGVSESNEDGNGDGYTNLEDYLNWMAQPHVMDMSDVDLTKLFAGYTNNPKFTITATTGNISASISGSTLSVSKTSSTSPLASVTVQATDDDGWGSLTRTINYYVSDTANGIREVKEQYASKDVAVYDISGRKVAQAWQDGMNLPNGIYIKGEKKVMVR